MGTHWGPAWGAASPPCTSPKLGRFGGQGGQEPGAGVRWTVTGAMGTTGRVPVCSPAPSLAVGRHQAGRWARGWRSRGGSCVWGEQGGTRGAASLQEPSACFDAFHQMVSQKLEGTWGRFLLSQNSPGGSSAGVAPKAGGGRLPFGSRESWGSERLGTRLRTRPGPGGAPPARWAGQGPWSALCWWSVWLTSGGFGAAPSSWGRCNLVSHEPSGQTPCHTLWAAKASSPLPSPSHAQPTHESPGWSSRALPILLPQGL